MTDTKEDLIKILMQAHDRHTSRFEKVVAKPRNTGEKLHLEPMMRNDRGEVLRDGVLNLPARCDFGISDGNLTTEKNLAIHHPDSLLRACYFDVGESQEIWLSSFAWNALDIQFQLKNEWPNFKPLRKWYLEWSLPPRAPLKKHTRGVLHRLSGPTPVDSTWCVSLDLGTAPPDAVVDLLNTLAIIGTKNVSLGANITADMS